jgi:hypothetical protein
VILVRGFCAKFEGIVCKMDSPSAAAEKAAAAAAPGTRGPPRHCAAQRIP